MAKIIKWVVIELIIFAVFITGSVILVTRFIQPYMDAQSKMPADGSFVFRQLESGQLEITWPKADQADYYIFQVYQLPNDGQLSYQNAAGKLVYENKVTDGNTVVIPSDAYTGNMLFKVSAARGYEIRQQLERILAILERSDQRRSPDMELKLSIMEADVTSLAEKWDKIIG